MTSYFQAAVLGLLQGVTELFPVSSLGHSVLVPAWLGGSGAHLTSQSSTSASGDSPYLAFIVALHVATALAIIIYFRADWVRILKALLTSIRAQKVETPTERLAWLIIVATIPVGVTGLALEHIFRTLFAKPLAATIFLTINGVILFAGERLRRRADATKPTTVAAAPATTTTDAAPPASTNRSLDTFGEAGIMGLCQTFALLAGMSRSGITMGRRHRPRSRPRGRSPVLVPARHPRHPRRRRPQTSEPGRVRRRPHSRPSRRRHGLRRHRRLPLHPVPSRSHFFKIRTLTPFAIYSVTAGVISIAALA